MYTYADDTTLIITAPTQSEINSLAAKDLDNLIKYFHSNNQVPNPTKTTYTSFHHQDPAMPLELTVTDGLYNHTLEHTKTAKLLGIYIQNNLQHQTTIKNIINKLQPAIQRFRYATTLLDTKRMLDLYYRDVYPHLIGAISIWGSQNDTKEYLQPLIRTHKKIIRILHRAPPRAPTAPLMLQLSILSLASLFTHRVCAEMHPYIHPSTDKPLQRPHHNHTYITITNVHSHGTRYSANHLFAPNSHKYSKTTPPICESTHHAQIHIDIWNALPDTIKNITSLPTFKKQLKKHLLEEQQNKLNSERQQGHHLA